MTKRKVSKIGPSTLMISLPSKWVKEYGVKKGDELDIEAIGRHLSIEVPGLRKGEVLEIDLDGLNANLIRYIVYAAYRNGGSEIKLKFSSSSVVDNNKEGMKVPTLEVIGDVVDTLVGVEIISQKNDYCLLKEISSVNHEEFLNTLRRIFITLVNTTSDIKDSIDSKNKTILKRINNISDKNLNKLCDFCFRVISKGGIVDNRKAPHYHSIISSLEEIGDSLKEIAGLAEKNLSKPSLLDAMHDLLEKMYRLFCNYKKETVVDVYELKRNIKKIGGKHYSNKQFLDICKECSNLMSEIIALNM
tara:strand:+ start:939 stop:1847 length:909 start_codon:yes stop_codon:yes gene_type:complete